MKKHSMFVAALAATLAAAGSASAGVFDYQWNGNIPFDSVSGPISVDINVPDSFTVADLDVDVIIEHTWQGDLIISLEHVDSGTMHDLIWRPGDSDGTGAGFSANNLGNPATGEAFIFDDEAAAFYDSAPPNGWGGIADPGIADVTGSWIPYSSQASGETHTLQNFDGLNSLGTWRLHVSDNAAGDAGSLQQFSLHFTSIPAPGALALLGLAGLASTRRRRG